jgi:hypothetical protein
MFYAMLQIVRSLLEWRRRRDKPRRETEFILESAVFVMCWCCRLSSTQSHHVAAQKEKKMDTMRAALKLGDVKEGEAFDRELQEQRKQERIFVREEKDRERREKQAAIEEEERRKEKEKRREAKDRKREEEEEDRKQRKREKKARHEKEEEDRRIDKLAKKRSTKDGERDRDHHR